MVLESLYSGPKRQAALARHLAAPMLQEREAFLLHLQGEGATQLTLKDVARGLIQTIRSLRLQKLRDVELLEVKRASTCWRRQYSLRLAPRFIWTAKRWLRFLGRLRLPQPRPQPYAEHLGAFTKLLIDLGLSPGTVRVRRMVAAQFLKWISGQRRRISSASLNDVDEFFSLKKAKGWSDGSIAAAAAALRSFFRYAENCHWCARGIAVGIKGPLLPRYRNLWHPPTWKEVQQLFRAKPIGPADIRARAVLFLLATCGLRAGEVVGLRLTDVDWKAKTLNVTRTKRRSFQRFPIQREAAASIANYVVDVRQQCTCPYLFVTLNPPFRPVSPSTVWTITSRRFAQLGINCHPRGPHVFRHVCARYLLSRGLSLKEIGDFLGHHTLHTVRVYAKCDMKSLRKVADFDLGGLR